MTFSTTTPKIISSTMPSRINKPKAKHFKVNILPDRRFWSDLKQLYYYGCNKEEVKPFLCTMLKNPINYTDLTFFELPDTNDFKHMDQRLLTHLVEAEDILNLHPDFKLNIENLFPFILYGKNNGLEQMPSIAENAYRFVLCLYIDTILFDKNLNITFIQGPHPNDDENITQKLKYFIVRIAATVFDEYANIRQNDISNSSSSEVSIEMINSSIQSDLRETQTSNNLNVFNVSSKPPEQTTKTFIMLESGEQFIDQIHSTNANIKQLNNLELISETEPIDESCQLEALPDTPLHSYISEIKIDNETIFKKPDRLYLIGPVAIRTRAYVECKEGFKSKLNHLYYFECDEHLKWNGNRIECEGNVTALEYYK